MQITLINILDLTVFNFETGDLLVMFVQTLRNKSLISGS